MSLPPSPLFRAAFPRRVSEQPACPYCCSFPALTKLQKVSNHPSLLQVCILYIRERSVLSRAPQQNTSVFPCAVQLYMLRNRRRFVGSYIYIYNIRIYLVYLVRRSCAVRVCDLLNLHLFPNLKDKMT